MGGEGFQLAFDRGEPLADVSVTFRLGVDARAATELINSIADDFDLRPDDYYHNPRSRIGSATRAALWRLFGWRIERAPLGNNGIYWWVTVTPLQFYPSGLGDLIEGIGLSQPGADDDGQPFNWTVL